MGILKVMTRGVTHIQYLNSQPVYILLINKLWQPAIFNNYCSYLKKGKRFFCDFTIILTLLRQIKIMRRCFVF